MNETASNLRESQPLIASLPNLRDIGGLPAGTGRVIRAGRVYRSQMLRALSADESARLAALNLSQVYDLRGPDEREATPHEHLPGHVSVRARDAGGDLSAVKITQWRDRLNQPEFDAAAAHAALVDNYQRMPVALGGELAALIKGLADRPAGPVLVHCSIGKDRTGFVVAALLRSVGVPPQAILQDYLRSGALLARQTVMLRQYRHQLFGDLPAHAEPAFGVMLDTHADYLNAAFDAIDRTHGSFDDYLAALDVSDAERTGARDHLVRTIRSDD